MFADATHVAATKDVTHHTTSKEDCGRGHKVIAEVILQRIALIIFTITVEHRTHRTCCHEVFLHRATQQGDIGRSVHIAASAYIRRAHATAIGIATIDDESRNGIKSIRTHDGTLVDDYIGVVFLAVVTSLGQGVVQSVLFVFFAVCISVGNLQTSVFIVVIFFYRHPFRGCHVSHTTIMTTTIDYIDLRALVQVHFGILRPGVLTKAGTIDGCHIASRFIRPHRCINIHTAIERTTRIVVATIEGTGKCISTVPVHITLIDIANLLVTDAIGTTKDLVKTDCRTRWHIDHRTPCKTFPVAATIDSIQLTTRQVDDGRDSITVGLISIGSHIVSHAQSAPCTSTPHLHIGMINVVVGHVVRNVNEDIAALLHDVAICIARIALTSTVNLADSVVLVDFQGSGVQWTEVDESLFHTRLCKACLGIAAFIEELTIFRVSIIIGTIAAAIDTLGITLLVLYVGRNVLGGICTVNLGGHLRTYTIREIGCSQDASTQVVATIDIVLHMGKTFALCAIILDLTTHIGLSMSENIGVTCTCKGVIDTTLTQVDNGITTHWTQEAAAIDEL